MAAGQAYRVAGRLADARVALARAAPIAAASGMVSARAEIDLRLARVTWTEDPARARSLATAALGVFTDIDARRSLALAEAWLRDHPAP